MTLNLSNISAITTPVVSKAPDTSSKFFPASTKTEMVAFTPNTPSTLLPATTKPGPSPPPPPTTSQTSPTIPTTFTLYPNLPLELRFKIIHHAIPLFPRILQVTGNATVEHDYDVLPTSITTLLQIDYTIRKEVIRYYSAPFTFTSISGRHVEGLRINWDIDTLYIQSFGKNGWNDKLSSFWKELFGENVGQVKKDLRTLAGSVAIGRGFWDTIVLGSVWDRRHPDQPFSRFAAFDGFVKLREVVLVLGPWTDGVNRLIRFEESRSRNLLYEGHVGWFREGFNVNHKKKQDAKKNGVKFSRKKKQRTRKVVTRLCRFYGAVDQRAEEILEGLY
ncbi:hypothetical protein ACEPPN_014500 [Leptodophora sp. 'Broadleaf-Isolate-01']